MENSLPTSSVELLHKLNSGPRKVRIGNDYKDVSEWVAWCGKTRKTRKAVETIEQLIVVPEALIIDDNLVEVMRFIARIEPEDDGRRLFHKMLTKSFTCTTLRSQFEQRLEVEDVMRLLGYSMEVLCVNYQKDHFDKALELCAVLLDSSYHKIVWLEDRGAELNGYSKLIGNMVDTCAEYTKLRAADIVRRKLPDLFAPARTDYYVQKVKAKRVKLV